MLAMIKYMNLANYYYKSPPKPERIMKVTPFKRASREPINGDIEFGPYRLTKDGELHCPGDKRVQLAARLACVLYELAAYDGASVSRLDLIDRCWPDEAIGEDSLTRAIADLRKIFRAHSGDCIETVYGLGYRLNTEQTDHEIRAKLSFCQEAWHRLYHRQRSTLDSAENLFTQVVSKDEEYLPAWLGLAETQIHRMQLGYTTTLAAAPKALQALDRALDLDSSSAAALAFKGLLLTWAEWDFAGAEELLHRACKLEPNAFIPNQARAWHELAMGRYELAEHYSRVASALDPMYMTARAGISFARMYLGDSGSALDAAREMVRVDAHGPVSLCLAAIFEAALGEPSKALSMAEGGFKLLPESPVAGAILAYARARAGLVDEARALLEAETKRGSLIGSETMASPAWMELGETGCALTALESGFATRCTWLLQMLGDPRIEALDSEPLRAIIFK